MNKARVDEANTLPLQAIEHAPEARLEPPQPCQEIQAVRHTYQASAPVPEKNNPWCERVKAAGEHVRQACTVKSCIAQDLQP